MCKTIDIHTHIMPKNIPKWADQSNDSRFIHLANHNSCEADMMYGDRFFRKVKSNTWEPEDRIKEMVETGVKKQVLSIIPVLFYYWATPQQGYDSARYFNDYIASVCSDYPANFYGLGTVPLQDPQLACKEMTRISQKLGLQGIEIGSHVNDWNLDRPELYPIYELAQALGLCIFIHPWDMMGQERMEKYWLPWLVGMPAESSLAICSLIFGGIFDKFPDLRIAVAHGGGSFGQTIGRIQHGFECRPDLVAVDNPNSPRDYLGKFWVDSLVHDTKVLEYNLRLFGTEKVTFGSDYPFPLGDLNGGTWIRESGLNQEVLDRIFVNNALDWLHPISKLE